VINIAVAAVFVFAMAGRHQSATGFVGRLLGALAPWLIVFAISGIKRLFGRRPVNYLTATYVITGLDAVALIGAWLPLRD